MSRTSKRVTASYSAHAEAATATKTAGPRAVASAPSAHVAESAKNGTVLSDSTSLDELFTAILGGDSREHDDRAPLLEAVDAQVSRLRKELGLVEPPPPQPPAKPAVPREFTFAGEAASAPSAEDVSEGPARFLALSQGMPDAWSRIPRPMRLGLPVVGLLLVGGLWLGLADSSPRDVSAEVSAPPPAAAPATTAAATSPSVPTSPATEGPSPLSSATTLSTPIPAPEPPPAVSAPGPGARATSSRSTIASTRPRSGGARPFESSPADVASPAAPNAAAGGAPVAAGTPAVLPTAVPIAPQPPVAATATPAAVAPAPAAVAPEATPEPTPTNTAAPVPANTFTVSAPVVSASATSLAPTPSPSAPAVPPSGAAAAAAAVPSSGGVSQPAVLISRANPVYPEAARRNRVAGPVDLVLAIDRQGNVVKATAVEGNPLLRQAAEEAARKWRYRPEFAGGVPVDTERRVRIVFQ